MPANGPLAQISRKKYGKRADHRKKALAGVFRQVRILSGTKIIAHASFRSDSHPFYGPILSREFPTVLHETVLSRKGCIVGQGELKKIGWDPLFPLNHTCAMLRAGMSRSIRRTWCTTKKIDYLKHHLWLYVQSHNADILEKLTHQAKKNTQAAACAD